MARVEREGPSLERLWSIRTDGSRRKLHPADVRGRFWNARRAVFAVLIVLALALPVVKVGGHPCVQLDVAARRFYLFGAVFNATDAWMFVFVLVAVAFSLLFVTAWKGRAWCGWACPQTVFLEGVYRQIERLVEGPGEKRYRLDQAPMSAHKLAKRVLKHTLFLAVSFFIAHSVVAYFVSIPSLFTMMKEGPAAHPEAFGWATAMTGLLYFNFAWFREQLCIVICPYGRLQSVLTDPDSTVVGYDKKRGEPRGKVGTAGAGDCVDCLRCVAVCPTGIDIRNGLQLECVACAQCIDACDEIMDKLKRPRGLVRYGTQRELTHAEPRKRRVRGRLIAYGVLTLLAVSGAVLAARGRSPIEARLLHTRGMPWVMETAPDGARWVRNQYELHLTNKAPEAATFTVSPVLPGEAKLIQPTQTVTLQPLESTRIPIMISVPLQGARDFDLKVKVDTARTHELAKARFLTPSMR